MEHSLKYTRVVEALHELESAIDELIRLNGDMNIHLPDVDGKSSPVNLLKEYLTDLWYRDSDDGRKTVTYTGVVECNPLALHAAQLVNAAKIKLQKEVQSIGYLSPAVKRKFNRDMFDSSSWRPHLGSIGLGRINLNHCYRKIPIHTEPVKVISYSWYVNGKSLKVINPKKAEALLVKLSKSGMTEALETQIQLLGQHPHHIPLVQVQELAPHLKANLFKEVSGLPKTMKPALPIFIPHCEPVIKYEKSLGNDEPTRKQRSDKEIEDMPFLPSIRVFRKIAN